MSTHHGSCHCGAVRYEVETDLEGAITCNCTHCSRKGFILVFVDADKFKLLSGADAQTEYQFGKKQIRHLFCKTCGVQSYAEGITFPKIAINIRCLEGVDPATIATTPFNGLDA